MEFELGHVLSITIMDVIGMFVNAWYLYTIKTRTIQWNAIDVLQASKTGMCLVALIVCIWTEFVTCSTKMCTGAKAIADNLFYYSTCCAFLAIAFVRYKACEYRGQASVLLTIRYAIKTLLTCFIPAGMFSTAILSLMINSNHSNNASNNAQDHAHDQDLDLLTGDSKIAYTISHVVVFIVSPIFASAFMYFRICSVVTQTARTMEGSMTNRKHDPAKLITTSVTVLLSTMFTLWGIYTAVRLVNIFIELNNLFFIYWKLVVFIVQPSVEGMLHKTGKKSSNPSTVQKLSQARSSRQIYPIDSAAPSDSILEEAVVGTKLPVLIEELETQAKTSDANVYSHLQSETDKTDCKKKTIRVRRQSFIHPRTSVVIRNAALIGLEYQSRINTLDNKSTPSPGKGNSGLLMEKDTIHKTRRLSNSLRFSTDVGNHTFDEIYHSYKTLYQRRGSEKSTKSHSSNEFEKPSFDGFNQWQGRKISTSSEGSESPSQKRWKKLYTTARTARKFSMYRKGGPRGKEEGHTEDMKGKLSIVREKELTLRPSLTREDQTFDVPSLYLEQQRRSLDSNKIQSPVPKQKGVAEKKRSISCVSNVWMKNNQRQPPRKKKSVSFISNIDVNDAPMSESDAANMTRSISYDSKIRISYRKDSEEITTKKMRHSHDHKMSRQDNNERRDIENWLSDKATTREECIAKLMEMKEYF